jgi:hypothetical protein
MKISRIKLGLIRFVINKGNQSNFEIKIKKMKIFYLNHCGRTHDRCDG